MSYHYLVTFRNVRNESPAGVYDVRWTRIGVVVGKVGAEVNPPSVICAVFEVGGETTVNNFLRSGDRVL